MPGPGIDPPNHEVSAGKSEPGTHLPLSGRGWKVEPAVPRFPSVIHDFQDVRVHGIAGFQV